ncbi:MAG: hypothetical protein NZ918_00395 [Aigarchaeota archaeon]|nr:hypothetical protein [Aigarchaeota archaeon]
MNSRNTGLPLNWDKLPISPVNPSESISGRAKSGADLKVVSVKVVSAVELDTDVVVEVAVLVAGSGWTVIKNIMMKIMDIITAKAPNLVP